MSFRWLTKRGSLTFSRSGWGLGGSPHVPWPPALAFKQVATWEHTEWGTAVEVEAGCEKGHRQFRARHFQPKKRGPNWREVNQLERIQGNSNRKDEEVERLIMRLSKSAALEAKRQPCFLCGSSVVTAKSMLGFQWVPFSFPKRALSVLLRWAWDRGWPRGETDPPLFWVPGLLSAGEEVLGKGEVHGQHSRWSRKNPNIWGHRQA